MREPSIYLSRYFIEHIWPEFSKKLTHKRARENYFSIINMICDFVKADFINITLKQAQKYFNSLHESSEKGKRLRNSTINCRLSALRSVSAFIIENRERYDVSEEYSNIFYFIDVPNNDVIIKKEDIPLLDELNKLLTVAANHGDTKMQLIFAMVIRCGFTASEICKMKVSQICEDKAGRFSVAFQERDRIRYVKLPEDVVFILLEYRKQIPLSAEYMFYNKKGLVLKVRNLESLVSKYVSEAGLSKPFTIQDIRNAAICYMKASGADDVSIAAMVGVEGRWLYRYDHVVKELDMQPVDMSKIRIVK